MTATGRRHELGRQREQVDQLQRPKSRRLTEFERPHARGDEQKTEGIGEDHRAELLAISMVAGELPLAAIGAQSVAEGLPPR